jgi:hypothetical protein
MEYVDKFYNRLALFFGYHDLGCIIFYPGRSLDTNAKSILLFPDSCIVTQSPKSKITVPMFNYTFYLLDVLYGNLRLWNISWDAVNLRLLLNNLSENCQKDQIYKTPQRAQRAQRTAIETLCELCVLCGERLWFT